MPSGRNKAAVMAPIVVWIKRDSARNVLIVYGVEGKAGQSACTSRSSSSQMFGKISEHRQIRRKIVQLCNATVQEVPLLLVTFRSLDVCADGSHLRCRYSPEGYLFEVHTKMVSACNAS